MQEVVIALRRYRRGAFYFSFVALFSLVEYILVLTNAKFHLFFSSFLPVFSFFLGKLFSVSLSEKLLLTAGIFISLCLLALLFYLRFKVNARPSVFLFVALYYLLDTLVLLGFALFCGDMVRLIDAVLHFFPLFSFLLAARAGHFLERVEEPTPAVMMEMLNTMLLPPEGLPAGAPVGDAEPDAEDSVPLREEAPRGRCLVAATLAGLDIRALRSYGLTELSVNGKVYAEQRGVLEVAYRLTATVEGHRITLQFSAGKLYGRLILLVDGRLLADVRRYI